MHELLELGRAFDGWLLPVLGFFLLPWTTLAYAVMWISGTHEVTGIEWFIVATSGVNFLIWALRFADDPDGGEASGQYAFAFFLDAFSRSVGIVGSGPPRSPKIRGPSRTDQAPEKRIGSRGAPRSGCESSTAGNCATCSATVARISSGGLGPSLNSTRATTWPWRRPERR